MHMKGSAISRLYDIAHYWGNSRNTGGTGYDHLVLIVLDSHCHARLCGYIDDSSLAGKQVQ